MNIYVGNLNYKVRETELGDFLSQFGHVDSVKIITDRETGRSKGFGFVEIDGPDNLIEDINGQEFAGRAIVAKEARPREER